jgi:hypothetical protein
MASYLMTPLVNDRKRHNDLRYTRYVYKMAFRCQLKNSVVS